VSPIRMILLGAQVAMAALIQPIGSMVRDQWATLTPIEHVLSTIAIFLIAVWPTILLAIVARRLNS